MSQPPFKTRVRSSCFQLYKQNILSWAIWIKKFTCNMPLLVNLSYLFLSSFKYTFRIPTTWMSMDKLKAVGVAKVWVPVKTLWNLLFIFRLHWHALEQTEEKNILMAFTFNLILWWLFKKIQGKCRSKKISWFRSSQPHLHLPRFHWRLCFRPRCRYRVITARHHHRIQIPISLSDSNNT